jgi:hypothetical protein
MEVEELTDCLSTLLLSESAEYPGGHGQIIVSAILLIGMPWFWLTIVPT